MNLTKDEITQIAESIGVDYASLRAFIHVESGGNGFNIDGKIIIQFEPAWFKKYVKTRKASDAALWAIIDSNKVEGQKNEWLAFNAAFKISAQSALLSTSIGLMQVMGFNYSSMGYSSVNAMWDSFKSGEYAQVQGAAMFIQNNKNLYKALKSKDWPNVAYYYNGSNYKVNNYDVKLAKAYALYNK